VVKLLLANDYVNLGSKDLYNWTPLLWVARNGHEAVMKLLFKIVVVRHDPPILKGEV
jgi:ankyrin repeat protein